MKKSFIYLVGPIAGCDVGEAKNWRDDIRTLLPENVIGVDPLRCEEHVGGRYDDVDAWLTGDPRFNTAEAIAAKNEFDTRSCDMVLAYMPKSLNERRPSYGSVVELAWAHMLGKPVILVSDDPYLMSHPLIKHVTSWRLPTFDMALDVISGVLGVYK